MPSPPTQHEAEKLMLQNPEVDRLRHWSKLHGAEAHLAGDLPHAQRICDLWQSYGITTELVRYDVLQNFPVSTSLKLHGIDGAVAFQASLTEDELPEDPTSSPSKGLPAFHGFAANGDVQAELVYANFGTLQDFQRLKDSNIDIKGKIVICKYGKVFRGLKVRAAQQFGAVGVIIYNDPQEDGEYTTKNGYQHYPDGPARHPSSIQRGSVDFFSVAVGDPSTPGYPSLPGKDTERKDPSHAIPLIPSLPVSFADAEPFLKSLNGHGLSPAMTGNKEDGWAGELEGVEYCTGPGKTKVSLSNQGDFEYSPIYNVIGAIDGITEESIVLGNHHDSWCCGAIDPVSGSAAMNEVARGLGLLLKQGWKPYRKIILASWDNEEYGLVGSTEWGEDNAAALSENCVAYLNVDESTNGGRFLGAVGSPLLDAPLRAAASQVPSPIYAGKTVYDDWLADLQLTDSSLTEPALTLMGTGSDYTVFFDHLGIPSVDMLFNRQGQGVYPYHSNYDSYYWVDKFGDVGFKKHEAMARLWGILAVKMAGPTIIPFQATDYAVSLKRHASLLQAREPALDLANLKGSIEQFLSGTQKLDGDANSLRESLDTGHITSEQVNRRLIQLERCFLLEKDRGLEGRPWYRHQIFAPGLWFGYDGVVFPAIQEALSSGDIRAANHHAEQISEAIIKATKYLEK